MALVEEDGPTKNRTVSVTTRMGGSLMLVSWKHKVSPCISVLLQHYWNDTHFCFKTLRKLDLYFFSCLMILQLHAGCFCFSFLVWKCAQMCFLILTLKKIIITLCVKISLSQNGFTSPQILGLVLLPYRSNCFLMNASNPFSC